MVSGNRETAMQPIEFRTLENSLNIPDMQTPIHVRDIQECLSHHVDPKDKC